MALVESFLFIFLIRDFDPPASSLLLGSAVAVMCAFELPVFYYVHHIFDRVGLTRLLSCCHVVFAVRCLAYTALPRDAPALVLVIEPLHGVTFACMWAVSVEYAKRN